MQSPIFSISPVVTRATLALLARLVKNLLAMQVIPVQFLSQEDPLKKGTLPTPVFMNFLGGSDGKQSACNVGDLGSIPGLGRSPGGGHGDSLQYSCLENPCGQRSLAGYSPWDCKESDTTSVFGSTPASNLSFPLLQA